MWMKLILLLVATVCAISGFVQKRSSVLTDESKRILDIFDFSNFDKQEALSYIDRQRFENIIRGKRSQWNLKRNLLKSNLSCGDSKYYSENADNDEYSEGGLSTNEEQLKFNPRNDSDDNLEYFEYSQFSTAKKAIRRARNVKLSENNRDLEERGSGVHEGGNYTSPEENDNRDDDDHDGTRKQGGKKRKRKKRHHWGKWSAWSRCSVTCGRGRKIRSRRCIAKSCASGEIEMGEKTCQLPACSLFDKLFSFFT